MAAKSVLAAALFAASLAASAARADTTTLATGGGWEAFGGTSRNGRPVCGVSTSPPNRYFGLKLFSGDDTFTIQLGDKAWAITDKSKYGVSMRFDNHPVWTTSATGMHFNDGDPGLEYEINKEEIVRFNTEFGSSKTMVLRFINGMDDWSINLITAREVNRKFAECNSKLR